ncbi:hypothetical protein L7F22_043584 [Adiantum nelumboides]|nr:hypothetical protein [Adiantum nelumboides]
MTIETEENKARLEREESPDEDFDGRKDDGSSSGSESDDAGSDVEGAGKKRKGDEVVELDEDEAKALLEDLGTDVREGKRIRRSDANGPESEENGTNAKEGPSSQSDEIWKSIQEGKNELTTSNNQQEEMVTVLRTYKFAGEEVVKEERLPASDPFAKQYLAKQAQANLSSTTSSSSRPTPGPRRKKGGGLAAMSAAATGKPDKLNTLEKSKMDWTKYKDSNLGEHERHEMDAQTKGGSSGLGSMKGYMERRNFLERVQDRLEGQEREPKK